MSQQTNQDLEQKLEMIENRPYRSYTGTTSPPQRSDGPVRLAWQSFMHLVRAIESNVSRSRDRPYPFLIKDCEDAHKVLTYVSPSATGASSRSLGSPGISQADILTIAREYGFVERHRQGYHDHDVTRAMTKYRRAISEYEDANPGGNSRYEKTPAGKKHALQMAERRAARLTRLESRGIVDPTPNQIRVKSVLQPAVGITVYKVYVDPFNELSWSYLEDDALKSLWDCFISLIRGLEAEIGFWESWIIEEHVSDIKTFHIALTAPSNKVHRLGQLRRSFDFPAGGPGVSVKQLVELARRHEIIQDTSSASLLAPSELQMKLKAYIAAVKDFDEQ